MANLITYFFTLKNIFNDVKQSVFKIFQVTEYRYATKKPAQRKVIICTIPSGFFSHDIHWMF
jgi:hypothetical protein